MKIAFLLPSIDSSAPNTVVKDLVDELVLIKELEIKVLYFDETPIQLGFACQTEKIKQVIGYDFSSFDIVHSHMFRPDAYIFFSTLFSFKSRPKIVTTLHQYNYEAFLYTFNSKLKSMFFSVLWDFFLIKHNYICVLTNDMFDFYKKRKLANKTKLIVINNGRPELTRPNLNPLSELYSTLPRGAVVFGTACRLVSLKGVEQCIKVLALKVNYYFVLMGSGPERSNLLQIAKLLGVEDRCFFLGHVSNPFDYYCFLDVVVIPSRSEGFSLSLIEAASARKPIVCSNIPTFQEIFNESHVCFFTLDRIEELASAIETAFINSDSLANNAYLKYKKSYTSKVMADNYFKLYSDLLSLK